MESINKNNRAVMRLLNDAKKLLGVEYSDEEFKQTFAVIKSAKTRGLLGSHKLSDCCMAESVNIANDFLRSENFDDFEINTVMQQRKGVYVYVALVALGLIPA